MKLKIFKSTLYTIIMVLSMHSYASSQGLSPEKEKDLEDKMQKLELKLKDMQVKLDSMKVNQKRIIITNGKSTLNNLTLAQRDVQKALAEIQRGNFKVIAPPMPPEAFAELNENVNKAFKGLNKTMNSNFNYNFNFDDKKLQEKIQSGEIKEKIKNYSKSYSVNPSDKLQIDNRYGKVTVTTWNKNEFKVDVEIKGIANDDDEAQKLLDGVSIADSREGSVVSFTTNIASKGGSWSVWSSNGKSYEHGHKVEVNYTIYMPSKSSLSITNKFGGTILPDFDGKIVINSSYGSLTAKTLSNPANDITSRYGSANIESLNGSDLKVAYGSLNLGTGDNLNANISYSSAKIDKIKSAGNIIVKYGGALNIGDLDKNFKSLSINSTYSDIVMGFNNGPSFNYDVTVSYGSFNYGDHPANISKTTADDEPKWNPIKNYKGHLGKGSSSKLVTINAKYGSVKFN